MNNSKHFLLVKKRRTYYFLGKDKKTLTRFTKDALIVSRPTNINYTDYGWLKALRKEFSNQEFEVRGLMNMKNAQEMLEQLYPLPRKAIPSRIRKQVYEMFNGRCAYCGCELEYKEMQVDHIVSHMGNKGQDDISNYFPACKDCNHFKMCSDIERFRTNIKDTIRLCSTRNKNFLWDRIYKKYSLDVNPKKDIKFYFEIIHTT